MEYGDMLQRGGTLNTLCKVKERSQSQRSYIEWLHLNETARLHKSIQTVSRSVVA